MQSFEERFESRGFLLVERAFDPIFIDRLRDEFMRQCTAGDHPAVKAEQLKVGDRRVMLTVQLTGPILDPQLYANPIILRIMSGLLGRDFVIDSLMCVTALPGAELQHLHRDHVDLFPELPPSRTNVPPYAVGVAIPLVDLDSSTGATRLYLGSHLRDTVDEGDESVMTFGKRGGCYLMDFRLIHQGTPNISTGERPIVYVTYARPWFTDVCNFKGQAKIRIDPSDLAAIPNEHRSLFTRLAAKGTFDRTGSDLFTA